MCWSLALGIGTTLLQYSAQQDAADKQNAYYTANAVAANNDAIEKYAQSQLALMQENAKATNGRIGLNREVVMAKGTAVASSENTGSSYNSVIRDLERQGAVQDNIIVQNLKNKEKQQKNEEKAIESEAQNRINSVTTASDPSIASAVISGLGETVPYLDNSRYLKPLKSGIGKNANVIKETL